MSREQATWTDVKNSWQRGKQPDGPWIANPDLINEEISEYKGGHTLAPDITREDHRRAYEASIDELPDSIEDIDFLHVFPTYFAADMKNAQGQEEHKIAKTVEQHYAGAYYYLNPRVTASPHLTSYFGQDWGSNARGIYYRHYCSPGWVTADHSLWLPSLDAEWNDQAEADRRSRARLFVKHILDNEKWEKSEYAWEADAWTDVFGLMRNDPVLAVDKHEYNTIGFERHPVSCLLTGNSKFIKRIPDATIGLATFKPQDYQNVLADWDLDRGRLEGLLLHRHCGLISDPRWGDASLAFPFAAYEAKGWSGDPREARRQACAAGAVYLDMLDDLTRKPGKTGKEGGVYQTARIHKGQVFVFTSFGAHWHILVGYKRPRLRREFAGYEGMSKSVYVFQRIWSGRVTTERTAWELLSLVDQIHLWGVTDFRDFVIEHLRPWHAFGRKCYYSDALHLTMRHGTRVEVHEDRLTVRSVPKNALQLPGWVQRVTEEGRVKLQTRANFHMADAVATFREDAFPDLWICNSELCSSSGLPMYPVGTLEDFMIHESEIHGGEDASIARIVAAFEPHEEAPSSGQQAAGTGASDLSSSEPRGRKRHREDTLDNARAAKKGRG